MKLVIKMILFSNSFKTNFSENLFPLYFDIFIEFKILITELLFNLFTVIFINSKLSLNSQIF